jgi:hypothetical protein
VTFFLRSQGNDASYGLLLLVGGNTSVTPSEPFTLALGETVSIANTAWSLSFDAVTEDSRCPVNVECVWAGQAVLHLTAARPGETEALTLTLGSETMVPEPIGDTGVFLTVSDLQPYPVAGTPIPQRAYAITAVVTLAG